MNEFHAYFGNVSIMQKVPNLENMVGANEGIPTQSCDKFFQNVI